MQHTKYFKSYNLVKFLIKSIVVVLGKRDFAYHIRKDVFPKIKITQIIQQKTIKMNTLEAQIVLYYRISLIIKKKKLCKPLSVDKVDHLLCDLELLKITFIFFITIHNVLCY